MNTLNKYNNGDFPHVLDNPTSDVTEMMKTVATVTYQLKHAGGYKAIVQRVKRTEHFISEPNLCPPLFGTLSANIVCQPHSLNKPLSQGFANAKLCLQQRTLKNVYCTLKGGTLTIFNTKPRDSKDGTIEIPVNNDTLLHIDKRFDSVVLSAAISKTEMVKELVLDFQKQREMEDWCQALSTQINDTKVYGDNATTDFDTYKNKEGEMSPFAVYETLLTSKGHIPKYLFGSVNALNYNEGEGKYSVGYKNNKIKPSKYPHTFNCHSIENKKPNRATAASVFENCPQPIATISNKPNSFQRTAIKGKRHPEIKCGTLISMSNNLRTKKMGIETTRL
uniref:PH domain-containing protein n=1 Tax=Rhabditophanes sp. KR3021 TaxID=114890 RepID=A0AC35TV31_9BILA